MKSVLLRAHGITSALATLRDDGMDKETLSKVATAFLDQVFGKVSEWTNEPELDNPARFRSAVAARRVIDGEGAWEAVCPPEQFRGI